MLFQCALWMWNRQDEVIALLPRPAAGSVAKHGVFLLPDPALSQARYKEQHLIDCPEQQTAGAHFLE